MFNKNCKRHQDQELTHFCSNQLCPQFLTFYCTQCDISKCFKHYHLQQFDNFDIFLSKIILPHFDSKQIEYCKSQMSKIINNFNIIQSKIINDYDEAIQKIINYIQQRSESFKNEIINQIENQKQFIEDKLNEFHNTINNCYGTYKILFDQAKEIFGQQIGNLHIEDHYRKIDMGELQDKYNILLRMQPELEILTTENSLQITKEQQIIDSLNHNVYIDLKDKIQEQSENILTLLWSKYYSMTSNIHLYDGNSSSIVQSEIVENIRISRSSSQSNYSVFNEIDNIIALGQLQLNTSLKLKSQTYGYTKFNLATLGQYNQVQNHIDLTQKLPPINCYCILVIRNQNIVLTAGEGSEIYLWIKKKDSNSWKMEATLSLNKDISFVQCMELIYNPFINESRTSRQSFANLKVLLNPIIAICSNNIIIIIQYDIMTNSLIVQCKYMIKDQKEQEIHTIIQCQTMGSYNYFIVGMEKGTLVILNYIISIDNTFTIKTDQIIKHHKDCITSIEIVGEQLIAVSSNDRSVSLWNFYNNKLKLLPIKMNRFWEDIPCVRQVYQNCFVTFDSNFNIQQWYLEDQNKISIINSISANKLKLEIHEGVIINNPENVQDFCIFLLTKDLTTKNCKIIILDRSLEIVQQEILPPDFVSQIAIKKKHLQYFTNYKMRIINDQLTSKSFSSFTDIKQNNKQQNQSQLQQQQSFSQQKQLNQNKRVSIGVANNNKTSLHFIEITYQIAIE